MEFRWVPHVFAIELKKVLHYRADFWIRFGLGTVTEVAVAYFLWLAIFEANGATTLRGFTFNGVVYYMLFASFAAKISRGSEHGTISTEIYDGTLTRYLVYPLPLMGFKYVTHVVQQINGTIQLLIALFGLWLILPMPTGEMTISAPNFLAGVFTCLLTGYLNFRIMTCLEMVAFWQDVVWNLIAMLRFTTSLLGGAMIPLVFFPEWGKKIVEFTPFPYLVTFPAKTFLGQITLNEWFMNAAILACWSLFFTILATWIWSRGAKQYSGVGI